MSEKRFEITRDGNFIFDNLKDDFLDLEDDCELLNKLSKENEQLKGKVKYWKYQCKKLLKFQEWCKV